MKKVSVIVPVYNVEKYLRRSLDCLVNQTLEDIEIILVNDGSKDGSQSIIDEYVKVYPDKIKAFYKENGGAANARNYALEHVSGEYIGFVDSDDYISLDMYEKLYSKAKHEQADIVCCNYYRVIEEEKFVRKQFGNININKDGLFNKNVYEASLLFDEVPYLWNKIFKTQIIKENDFKFCNDLRIYEDLLFVYQAFSKANKISRIEDAMYYYIVAREGSLTQMLTPKRFDITKASERLIDYYKKQEGFEKVEQALLYVILKHVYVVLEKNSYAKEKKLKQQYINMIFKFLNNKFPGWKNNMYFTLQEKSRVLYTSKAYWKLCTILGVEISAYKKKLIKILEIVANSRIANKYNKQSKKKLKEDAIFMFPQQGSNLNGNMFYLVKAIANNSEYNKYKIYIGYSDGKKESFDKLLKSYNIDKRVKLIKHKTKKFATILARSKYLFTDTSMPTYFIKREEQVYINTWHGTPLKTLGKSTENDFYDIANVQKNFVSSDYLLYPNEYMMKIMIEDYMLSGIANNKIMLCGYPRNENFLRQDSSDVKEKIGLGAKTLIAYMPTWRGGVRDFDKQVQINIANEHIKKISQGLKENQMLYVNMHPFIGNSLDLSGLENVKTFPKDFETYDFLSICDILITDYSSVFFDFAPTNKKIILFAYDEKEYFENRGVYLPFTELPFPKVKTVEELLNEINQPINYEQKEFLERFCSYDRADISKQICEKVILNKNNEIKILDMPKENKENVLVYLGDFEPNDTTKYFLNVVNNSCDNQKYNYYVSYITSKVRQNKDIFKNIVNKVKFYGQLGNYSSASIMKRLFVKLLVIKKKLYHKHKSKLDKINKLELKRIHGNIKYKALILYGAIETSKIYQLSKIDARTILYIDEKVMFNKQVSKEIYNNLDCILTSNKEAYDAIKKYCGQTKNIKLINKINSLEDFNKYINK